jgi:hypothetical protein
MGSGCSAPDTGIKNINPTVVHGKTVEGTDLQIQQMMALSEDGSNFKVKVEVIEGPHKGEHHVFLLHPGKDSFKIGSDDEECNLVLEKDDEVSGEHGKIVFNGAGHIYYYDLESTNGSWVNDKKVEEGKRFHDPILSGHVIKLGENTKLGIFETDLNGIEQEN